MSAAPPTDLDTLVTGNCYECFMSVNLEDGFLSAVAVPSQSAQLWTKVKQGCYQEGCALKLLVYLTPALAYTAAELAAATEVGTRIAGMKRGIDEIIVMIEHDGLVAASRILAGCKIPYIHIMPPDDMIVSTREDAQVVASILAINKPRNNIRFTRLAFAGDVMESSIGPALRLTNSHLTSENCSFVGAEASLASAIAASKKMTTAKFVGMSATQDTHDFTVQLLHGAAASKLGDLTVTVPIWTPEMEAAVAHCLDKRKSLRFGLTYELTHPFVQRMEQPGQSIVQLLKEKHIHAKFTFREEGGDEGEEPRTFESSSYLREMVGEDAGKLIDCYCRLNMNRYRHANMFRVQEREQHFATLADVSDSLDCLFLYLIDSPLLFGDHAMKGVVMKKKKTTKASKAKLTNATPTKAVAASGPRKRKVTV